MGWTFSFQEMDLATMKVDDVDFTSTFRLHYTPNSPPPPSQKPPSEPSNNSKTRPQNSVGSEIDGSVESVGSENFVWCHGLVMWFDTSFSKRFCVEKSGVLSTSPFGPPTHWSQTILTFKEPIAIDTRLDAVRKMSGNVDKTMSGNSETPLSNVGSNGKGKDVQGMPVDTIGSKSNPAVGLSGRISIARSARHRSVDISLETSAVGQGGKVRQWPAQMFDM